MLQLVRRQPCRQRQEPLGLLTGRFCCTGPSCSWGPSGWKFRQLGSPPQALEATGLPLSAFLPLLLGCSGPFWGSGTRGVSLLFAPLPLGAGHREAGTALALLAPDGAWEALALFPCAGSEWGGEVLSPQASAYAGWLGWITV